ncbi:hypothetical protein BKA66DRAFT_467265 [Pyrenochaeta sp. MPI-SDFR-AT-0127]|nr:hypothetical protein BKA66DRAFT_467265 [Pyrenochaeta sp. MPI-SDFR-AT-0127]
MSMHRNLLYKPFPPAGRHIRVLILQAGEIQDPIQCVLQMITLDDESGYEALSYTWGDQSITKSIEVNKIDIKVTLNLESALRYMIFRFADWVSYFKVCKARQRDLAYHSVFKNQVQRYGMEFF